MPIQINRKNRDDYLSSIVEAEGNVHCTSYPFSERESVGKSEATNNEVVLLIMGVGPAGLFELAKSLLNQGWPFIMWSLSDWNIQFIPHGISIPI